MACFIRRFDAEEQETMLGIEQIEWLLIVAALVAVVARRLHFPYTVGLVVAGIGLGFAPIGHSVVLTKDLVFGALLPPLVFEAALNIRWRELRRDSALVGILATVGVLASAGIVAFGMSEMAGWAIGPAWVFATLISATDPVSVVATFKEFGGHGRLRLLVEAESLVNDGTAAVGFGIAVAAATGAEQLSAGAAIWDFMLVSIGGVAVGAAVAGVALTLIRTTNDHLVELVLTTVVAYGSFLLAEHLHLSGILGALTAGLILGNLGEIASFTERGRDSVEPYWEFAAFVANSIVFLLIGMRVAHIPFIDHWPEVLLAIGLVLAGRAASVYGICFGFAWSSRKVKPIQQHVLFWGGLRGALALALVLGLPEDFPYKSNITVAAFGVVAFSVLVQGLTMGPLLKRAVRGPEV